MGLMKMIFKSNRTGVSNSGFSIFKIGLVSLILCSFSFSQDAPEDFEFNVSIFQSFYFFLESDIDGTELENGEDWIASFNIYDETNEGLCSYIEEDLDGDPSTIECQDLNNDGQLTVDAEICTGSYYWDGPYTTVPVMGVDGTRWTLGYMEEGELPIFKIYDASENSIYPAIPSIVYPWTPDLNFYVISISVLRDCDDVIGGSAVIDDCGDCSEGTTELEFNYADLGCGCYNPAPDPYYEDVDGDGLGYGEIQYFCEHPGLGWTENDYDEFPDCFYNVYDCNDDCDGNAFLDDCGVCSGGNTNHAPNSSIDCNGDCFGGAYFDDCDYCVGGNTGVEPCEFISDQPEEFYYQQSTLQAFYFIINAYIGDGDPVSYQDWIGVFNNDVCVGAIKYDGAFTTVPAMGDDGSDWTEGYLAIGDFPTFKLWDASQNLFYPVNTDIVKVQGADLYPYTGWFPNDYYNITEFQALVVDCSGVLGGGAYYDSCGSCVGGTTGIEPDLDMDCYNVCNGDAYYDNCGICVGGTTGVEPNLDDLGCGCYLEGPSDYYSDFDDDGFGYGDPQGFCENPGEGWSDNALDPDPYCFNVDINTSLVDDCGVCEGNNQDQDCAGVCFGNSIEDDCGVCGGDNSSCNAPVAENLSYSLNEDESLEITLIGSDPNNNPITFIIVDNPEFGQISGEYPDFLYTPNANFNGQDSFTYQSYNGTYYSETSTVSINVEPINDAPIVYSSNIELNEDSAVVFNLSGSDIDADLITFSIVQYPSHGEIELVSEELTYTPYPDYYGFDQISIIGFDGQEYSSEAYIDISINPINDAPVMSDIEDNETNEDTEFQLSLSSSDIDSEDLFYSVSVDGNASAYVSDDTLHINPFSGFDGDIEVNVFVSDGYLSDSTTFTLSVIPVNDPPVLSFIGGQIMDEDTDLTIDLSADDPEDDVLEYSFELDNASGILDGSELTITPTSNFNGDITLTVTVSDGELTDSETLSINVLAVNDPPYFITSEILNARENEEYIQVIEYGDVDNDSEDLTLTISNSLGWINIIDGNIMGTPSFNDGGDNTILLNLSDLETSSSFEYQLTIEESNQPPISSNIDLVLDEDSSIEFTLLSIDSEGDNLTYSYTSPSSGSITGNAPYLIYTPDSNFNGEDNIEFTASDFDNSSNIATVSIDVISINDIPTAQSVSFNVDGDSVSFDLTDYVSDQDGDNLLFNTVPPSSSSTQFSTLMGGSIEYISDYQFRYIKPSADIAADYAIYKVSDEYSESSVEIITFIIDSDRLDTRLAPSALDDNVSIMEDIQSDISLIGFDIFGFPQDGTAEIIITQNPENGTISNPEFSSSSTNQLAQWIIEYSPSANFSGNDEIKYRVINPNNNVQESEEGTISIIIAPVNDAPSLDSISDQNIDEDEPLTQIVTYLDVDDNINLSASASVSDFVFEFEELNSSESNLEITPPLNYYGFATITVTASEQEGDLSVSQIFNLNISPVNDAPSLDSISNQNIDEDESILINLSAADIDYDNLSFSAESDNESILVDLENNLLTISGLENYFGEGDITVTVTDNQGGSDIETFEVSINSINDIPTINDLDSEVIEDGIVSIFPEGSDVEGSDLTFSVSSEPSNGSISLVNWFFTYTPDSNFNGQDSFTYIAFDGDDYSEEATINISISEVNDPPVIADIENQSINEDSSLFYVLDAEDIDGDPLSYSYIADEDTNASINGNILTVSFDSDFNGDVEIEIQVNDGELSDSDSFIITVIPVNDSPTVQNPIEDINLDEDFGEYIIDISDVFTDIDLDALEYSYEIDDNDLISTVLNNSQLVISSIPDQSGESIGITITADDRNRRLTVSDSFEITINEINDAPISYDVVLDINEDQGQIIQPDFSDVDSNDSSISIDIVSIPQHGSLNIQGQGFLYSPESDFNGVDFFTYRVYDGELYSNDATIFVYVLPTNDPPLIVDMELQQMDEDSTLQVNLNASDIDQDLLIFNASSDNAEVLVVDSILMVTPELNYNGSISIVVTVTDGEYFDDTELFIEVLPVNDAPEIINIENQEIEEDSVFTINLQGTDIDGDLLDYSAESDTDADISISGNLLSLIPPINFNGNILVTVYADDGELSDSTSFNLSVTGINDAPVLGLNEDQDMNEDSTLEITIFASDVDEDFLTFEAELEDNVNATISIEGNIVTISPNTDWYGQLVLNISVSDIYDLEDSGSITVNVLPVNDTPAFSSTPNTIAVEDEEYLYQLEVSDPDSDEFYFYLLMYPEGMTLSEDGLISWTPLEGVLNSGFVSAVVWDTDSPQSGIDYPGIQEFQIIVSPVNDAPKIVSDPISNAIEDQEYLYQVDVSDIDSDSFIFTLENNPEGMTINEDGLISWTPLEGVLTSGLITIYVHDDEPEGSLYDSQTFAISVTPINDSPNIASIAPTEATQGSLYEYEIEIIDPDDDSFTFQLIGAPEGMNIDFSTSVLSWIPEEGGVFGPITLKVFDGGENFSTPAVEIFTINVEFLSDFVTMEFDLHEDNNLISFLGIPENPDISVVLNPLGDNANQVITEGLASTNSGNFGWVGSLDQFEADKGYWLGLDSPAILEIEAMPTDSSLIYNIHDGYNLVSYIGPDEMPLDDALPDFMEQDITDILTEGMAATRHPELGWVGSLASSGFRQLKGYWLKNATLENIEFSWVFDSNLVSSRDKAQNLVNYKNTPEDFKFVQSTRQAFYFFDNIIIDGYEIKEGDWILAFNDNQLVGSRKWTGAYTDVPVMGYDGSNKTLGYCDPSDIPSFKLYNFTDGALLDIDGSFPAWSDLGTYIVDFYNDLVPVEFSLSPAYPNPFNPITHIEYSVPYESKVSITIYDLVGREVAKLVNDIQEPGYYSVAWEASAISSGMYFIKMKADNFEDSQKAVLIK